MAVVPVSPQMPIQISVGPDGVRAGSPLTNLAAGQSMNVSVAEKNSPNQYLMASKNGLFRAESSMALNVGDKLQVRVQALEPQIVLHVLDPQKQVAETKVNERLLQWRLNPDSLTQLLSKVDDFSAILRSGDVSSVVSRQKIDILIQLFSDIVFSGQTKTNPLFIKDFISQLGLLLEHDLGEMVLHQAKAGPPPALVENLKAALLTLSASLADAQAIVSRQNTQLISRLMNLSEFVSEALKTIEAKQAVSIVYQRSESGLYLQVPLAMGEALRQAEIFITPDDKNAPGAKKFSSCSIVMFLDLDYLGEIQIDASLREGRIRCVIKCSSDEVRDLVSASAWRLKEALGGIGYGIEKIESLKVAELTRAKADYFERRLLGSMELLNLFA